MQKKMCQFFPVSSFNPSLFIFSFAFCSYVILNPSAILKILIPIPDTPFELLISTSSHLLQFIHPYTDSFMPGESMTDPLSCTLSTDYTADSRSAQDVV